MSGALYLIEEARVRLGNFSQHSLFTVPIGRAAQRDHWLSAVRLGQCHRGVDPGLEQHRNPFDGLDLFAAVSSGCLDGLGFG